MKNIKSSFMILLFTAAVITILPGCNKYCVDTSTSKCSPNSGTSASNASQNSNTASTLSSVAYQFSGATSMSTSEASGRTPCQTLALFQQAIASGDLLTSTAAYCSWLQGNGGSTQPNCNRAQYDAQRILLDINSLNETCRANPAGDLTLLTLLVSDAAQYRLSLGLPNRQ